MSLTARRLHRWVAVTLVGVLMLTTAVPVAAKKPVADETDYEAVTSAIDALAARGASQAQIDRMLERDFGWVVVGRQATDDGQAALLSSQNFNVSLSVPTIYFNTSSGRYEAAAMFAWRSCPTGIGGSLEPCYMQDYGGSAEMGGYDAFGIRLSKLVSRRGHVMTVAASTGCRTVYTVAAEADDSGAVFRNQDGFFNPCGTSHYNWHRGTIVYSFLLRPGCPKGEYKIDTKMAHTWQSTSITSASVSTSGVSITFSLAANQWTGVSTPRTWTPCGT